MFNVHKHIRVLTLVLVASLALTGVSFAQPGGGSPDNPPGGGRGGGNAQPGGGGGAAPSGGSPGGQSFQTQSFEQNDRPAPSTNGGNLGGPAMGGEAVNAGRTDVPTRSGSRTAGGATRPGDDTPGGNAPNPPGNRELPNAGGENPRTGNRPFGGSFNQVPEPGSAEFLQQREAFLSSIEVTGGGGFGPLVGSPADVSARFGERGIGELPIQFGPMSEDSPPWVANLEQGGFGANTDGGPADANEFRDVDPGMRRPAELEGEAAPGAYDNLSSLDEAAEANEDVAETQEQAADDTTQEQAADDATAAASERYDTFWADYYEAVDETADTYYDTTTAVADYYLDVYVEAVDYTTEAVDYYVDYAEQYDDYCATYPFDCYSYTYDYSTNTYYYTGDISTEPAGTAEAGTVTTTETLTVADPEPSVDAYRAVVLFANDHLAAAVEPLYAGSATPEVGQQLALLPDQISARVLNSTTVAGETYWGLLNGGVAGVMVGDCTDGECVVTNVNLSILLSSESAGVYGLLADAPYPPDSSVALQLITDVYPKLDGLAFTQLTDVDGYAFTASAAGLGYDETTQSSVSVTKVIYAGTVEVEGQPFVYVLVGVGETYTALIS